MKAFLITVLLFFSGLLAAQLAVQAAHPELYSANVILERVDSQRLVRVSLSGDNFARLTPLITLLDNEGREIWSRSDINFTFYLQDEQYMTVNPNGTINYYGSFLECDIHIGFLLVFSEGGDLIYNSLADSYLPEIKQLVPLMDGNTLLLGNTEYIIFDASYQRVRTGRYTDPLFDRNTRLIAATMIDSSELLLSMWSRQNASFVRPFVYAGDSIRVKSPNVDYNFAFEQAFFVPALGQYLYLRTEEERATLFTLVPSGEFLSSKDFLLIEDYAGQFVDVDVNNDRLRLLTSTATAPYLYEVNLNDTTYQTSSFEQYRGIVLNDLVSTSAEFIFEGYHPFSPTGDGIFGRPSSSTAVVLRQDKSTNSSLPAIDLGITALSAAATTSASTGPCASLPYCENAFQATFSEIEVEVKNEGEEPISSFYLNTYYYSDCACIPCGRQANIRRQLYSDLDLQPGASLTVNFPGLFVGEQLDNLQLCLWTSAPNGQVDLHQDNDYHCSGEIINSVPEATIPPSLFTYHPASRTWRVTTTNTLEKVIQFFDLNGRLLRTHTFRTDTNEEFSAPAGIYFYRLKEGRRIGSGKFIQPRG